MTYFDYELLVKQHLEKELERSFHQKINIRQQENLMAPDGNSFNIDLNYRFTVSGVDYHTIIECKYWKTSVGRDKVLELAEKRNSLKAHKAILVTTKNFQSGAIEYARSNGIGLIKMTSKGKSEIVNHFIGNYDSYSDELSSESAFPADKEFTSIGTVSPSNTIEEHLRAIFTEDQYKALIDFLESDKIPMNGIFADLPMNCIEDYVKIETSGLDMVLSNEGLIRQISLLISLNDQEHYA